MNKCNNDDISDTDNWLDTTLRQWADRSVGKLPCDLHSQVVCRMARPMEKVNYQKVIVTLGALLFCGAVSWWLILSNSGRKGLAEADVAGSINAADPAAATTSDAPELQGRLANTEENLNALQEIQKQIESLEAQLLIGQMDANISEMEERCTRLRDRVAQREQNCEQAAIKHSVITDWLANP